MAPQRRDWSLMPTELLAKVSSRLAFRDNIRFAAVCRCWRSAAFSGDCRTPPPLIAFVGDVFRRRKNPGASFTITKSFDGGRSAEVIAWPDGGGGGGETFLFFGAWIVLCSKVEHKKPIVFNPHTKESFELPPLDSLDETTKIVLKPGFTSSSYMAAACYLRNSNCTRVSFVTLGDSCWTRVAVPSRLKFFQDMVFHAVDGDLYLMATRDTDEDISMNLPGGGGCLIVMSSPSFERLNFVWKCYLVTSGCELLMVCFTMTPFFLLEVFRLHCRRQHGGGVWVLWNGPLVSLGGSRALLLSEKNSMLVVVAEEAAAVDDRDRRNPLILEPNRIYILSAGEIIVYDMISRKFLMNITDGKGLICKKRLPMWFLPNSPNHLLELNG